MRNRIQKSLPWSLVWEIAYILCITNRIQKFLPCSLVWEFAYIMCMRNHIHASCFGSCMRIRIHSLYYKSHTDFIYDFLTKWILRDLKQWSDIETLCGTESVYEIDKDFLFFLILIIPKIVQRVSAETASGITPGAAFCLPFDLSAQGGYISGFFTRPYADRHSPSFPPARFHGLYIRDGCRSW